MQQLKKLDVIVVERDDFKVMLARLRGVLPEGDEASPEEEVRGPLSGGGSWHSLTNSTRTRPASSPKAICGPPRGRRGRTHGAGGGGGDGVGHRLREDFEDVVSGGSGGSAPAPDENQMMDIFDEIDADGTGFAQRLDLKNRIAELTRGGWWMRSRISAPSL